MLLQSGPQAIKLLLLNRVLTMGCCKLINVSHRAEIRLEKVLINRFLLVLLQADQRDSQE